MELGSNDLFDQSRNDESFDAIFKSYEYWYEKSLEHYGQNVALVETKMAEQVLNYFESMPERDSRIMIRGGEEAKKMSNKISAYTESHLSKCII